MRTFTPLLGAELALHGDEPVRLGLDPAFEHALLVDGGDLDVDGTLVAHGQLAYLEPGRDATTVRGASGVRVLLLGGTPFGEEIVMWWNFVGRSHDDVAEQRAAWQARSSRFTKAPCLASSAPILPGTSPRSRARSFASAVHVCFRSPSTETAWRRWPLSPQAPRSRPRRAR